MPFLLKKEIKWKSELEHREKQQEADPHTHEKRQIEARQRAQASVTFQKMEFHVLSEAAVGNTALL